MKSISKRGQDFRFSSCRTIRSVVSVALIALLGMEILPWGLVECVPAVPGGPVECTLGIEPLQVCDDGDPFAGVLFDLPLLLPGAPFLLPSTEAQPLFQQSDSVVSDGFRPAIDRPPQVSA